MTALVLQGFACVYSGANNVSVPHQETVFSKAVCLHFWRNTLFEDPDALQVLQIVEYNSALTSDHDNLAHFVRIDPAHVEVCNSCTWISEGRKNNVLAIAA